MHEHIESLSGHKVGLKGVIIVETRDALTGALIPEESCVVENIVTDVGLARLAGLLAQVTYSTGFQISVGTSTTAAAAGDVALGAQVLIANTTSQAQSGAVAIFKLFIDTTQANGSPLAEAGLWFDGVLIDHAILSSIVAKTSGKTCTVTIQITLSR
jgi:hypothetical protein